MLRYAVLWEPTDGRSQPVGLVLETPDSVRLELPQAYGMPTRYDGEYRVLQPDMTEVVYRPGDPHYFDHTLIELMRHFAVCDLGEVQTVDEIVVGSLLDEHVLAPRTARRRADYPAGIFSRRMTAGSRGRPCPAVYRGSVRVSPEGAREAAGEARIAA